MAPKSAPASTMVIDAYAANPEIARYESMRADEVDNELRRQDIDPQPTIELVKELVQSKLAEWERRKKA